MVQKSGGNAPVEEKVVYPSFYRVFIHPRWCRISSINSMNILMWLGKI